MLPTNQGCLSPLKLFDQPTVSICPGGMPDHVKLHVRTSSPRLCHRRHRGRRRLRLTYRRGLPAPCLCSLVLSLQKPTGKLRRAHDPSHRQQNGRLAARCRSKFLLGGASYDYVMPFALLFGNRKTFGLRKSMLPHPKPLLALVLHLVIVR